MQQDLHIRRLIAAVCVAGSLLLVAASMFMNWSFWRAQGSEPWMGQAFGAVSIGLDIFKVALPLVIAWAWDQQHRQGYLIGIVLFCGCLAFSLVSALGVAATARGTLVGGKEATAIRYAAAEQEARDVKARLEQLGVQRPTAVIEGAAEKAKQDRYWASSKGCTDATIEVSRVYCRGIADLRIELAAAIESERLKIRAIELQTEINRLLGAGARLEQDGQAGILSRLSGFGLEQVQSSLAVLFAVLVELGAAFGLFLALLPLRGRHHFGHVATRRPAKKSPTARATTASIPKRLVRSGNQLMIE